MNPTVIAFLAYMIVVGLAVGAAAMRWPALTNYSLFIALALMATFEIAVAYSRGISPTALLTMPERLIGLAMGVGLLMLFPHIVARVG